MADTIADRAKEPKKVVIDGQVVEAHGLKDQREVDIAEGGKATAKTVRRGLLLTKLRPPGGCG